MSPEQPEARPQRRRAALAVLAVVGLLSAVAWLPGLGSGPDEDDGGRRTVAGTGLAVPFLLRLPAGAVTTADRSWVGLRLDGEPGGVLVTVPTQVRQPSGMRTELPENPAAWLIRHPELAVTRVRPVSVAGRAATQVDYALAPEVTGTRRTYGVPLFCGWKRELGPGGLVGFTACTRITAGARARATFVPVGERTVIVEALWPADASADGRMPPELRSSYRALLVGVTAGG